MPEYIERNEILAQIEARKKSIESAVNFNYRAALSDVCKIVADIPAADVVEVVRCGQCGNYCKNTGECNLYGRHPNVNDFCNRGEQKDGGSDE